MHYKSEVSEVNANAMRSLVHLFLLAVLTYRGTGQGMLCAKYIILFGTRQVTNVTGVL